MGVPQFSILDLAPVREGGSIAETYRNALDLAKHAERWGFTRYWFAEHHSMAGIASAATSILIGHVAAGTSKIRVGSGGIMLPNHASLVIAEQFGTKAIEEAFPQQVEELLAYLGPEPTRPLAFPGTGTNVPVWLLGSSTYSARLAAQLGLPFAFASHFAPLLLHEALDIYRAEFQPSQYLLKPYAIAGVPLVAAETDDEARRLATSALQRHLRLIRGQSVFVPPPVETMAGRWSPAEQFAVESRMSAAAIGGPATIRERLGTFLQQTGVDELIFTSDLYEHRLRLRSFEIAAEAMKTAWT